jgi:predicted ATPase/DNA-binding SARP family transcriptional activator
MASDQILRLQLLGDPKVTYDGRSLTRQIPGKALALLTYLAIERRAHPRSTLAGLLWSDSAEEDARRSLRVALAALNRLLPGYVIADRQTVAFNLEKPYWLDVEAFRQALHKPGPNMQSLQTAAALYQGDFLENFSLRGAPLFEVWVVVEREELRRAALDAMDVLADRYASLGGTVRAIETARRIVALDSWREEAHYRLMSLLARAGQRSAALRQFDMCRQALAEGLGVAPAPKTVALYEQIKAGEPTSAITGRELASQGVPAIPHNLPAPTTAFVGRESELKHVYELLRNPACRLLSVIGPGGVGKTRLALQAARLFVAQEDSSFGNGVFYLPLAAIGADGFLPALAGAFNLWLDDRQDLGQQIINHLSRKTTLLILDNFEHLVKEAGWLVKLLESAAGVKVLITTREPLNLYEEWRFTLDGLELPDRLTDRLVEEFDAVRLFVQRARRVHLGFRIEEEREAVVRICRLLESLPLGIELAAVQVRTLSCAQIATEIQRNLDALMADQPDVPQRHHSLRAVFEHSWKLLNDEEQRSLAKLSVFQGGFRPEAAEAIAGASLRTLSSLLDKSFLQRSADGRYDLHEVTRQYTAEKLDAMQAESQPVSVADKHTYYFSVLLSQLAPTGTSVSSPDLVRQVNEELNNIRAAWDRAVMQHTVDALERALNGLALYYDSQGWFEIGESDLHRAAESLAGRPGEALVWARLTVREAHLCFRRGALERARRLAAQALPVFERLGESQEIARALLVEGSAARDLGHVDAAAVALQRSFDIAHTADDRLAAARALAGLGVTAFNRGELVQAQAYFDRSLVLLQEAGNRDEICVALGNLGMVNVPLGNAEAAERYLRQGLELARQLNRRLTVVVTLQNLGVLLAHQQDFPAAESHLLESLTLCQEIGSQSHLVRILNDLGNMYTRRGDDQTAQRYYHECLKLAEAIGQQYTILIARFNLAEAAYRSGDFSKAHAELRETLRAALDSNTTAIALDALAYLAALRAGRDEDQAAQQVLRYVRDHPQADVETQQAVDDLLTGLSWTLDQLPSTRPPVSLAEMAAKVLAWD